LDFPSAGSLEADSNEVTMGALSTMSIKTRNDIWGWEMAVSVAICVICWVGTIVAMAGIADLPKCKYGDAKCYFFVKVCDADLLHHTQSMPTCYYMAKHRKTEGSSEDGLEQVAIPFAAAAMGLVPGPVILTTMAIRNERCLFSLLDYGKMFILLNLVLLVMSSQLMSKITWDCRFFGAEHQPDSDKCGSSYTKYLWGSIFIFVAETALLIMLVVYSEMEKKRVNQDSTWFTEPASETNPVQMGGGLGNTGNATEMPMRTVQQQDQGGVNQGAW